MKSYWSEGELRLVGKAWEIRYYLRRMMREHAAGTMTVAELLQKRRPASA